MPTALVGTLVRSLTDVPRPTVEALVESLHHDMVAADDDLQEMLLPEGHRLVGLDEAFRRSLAPRASVPEDSDPVGPLPQTRRGPAAVTTTPRPGQGGRRSQEHAAQLLKASARLFGSRRITFSIRGHSGAVQTFLPYADFERSAHVLDHKRLGKQRVETIQVVRALTRVHYGWKNHPAVLMWKGFEEALGRYGFACCEAWTELGFGDTCALTIAMDLRAAGINAVRTESELAAAHALPPWLGDEAVHRSHQSALVRKDREHYAPLFPGVPDDLAYVWPVRSASVVAAEQRKADNAERRTLRQSERAQLEAERLQRRRDRAAK